MSVCPVCDLARETARCRHCHYDFDNADPHPAIAKLQGKLSRARWTWVLGLLALIPELFLISVLPFGGAFVVLLVLIFGTPVSVLFGLGSASDYKKQLRSAAKLLPQLPAARVVQR